MIGTALKSIIYISRHPGVRGSALRAIWRYLSWQFVSRFTCLNFSFNWVNEAQLYVNKSEAMVTHTYYTGLLEYSDMLFTLRFLRSQDNFLDIGANSGLYTVLASKCGQANSLSIEPIPNTFERLQKNCLLNGLAKKTILKNIALGNEAGKLKMTANFDATNHIVLGETNEANLEVEVSTVDLVCEQHNFSPIFIKLDVEGFEEKVLEGANKILSSSDLKIVLVECNESGLKYGIDDETVSKRLMDYGFEPFSYNGNDNTLTRINTLLSGDLNTLFIKDLDFVKDRLDNFNSEIFVHNTKKIYN